MAQGSAANGGAPVASAPVPIFLSGSHHREACCGIQVASAPAMVAELRQKREEKAIAKAKGLPTTPPKPAGPSGSVTVKELIDAGLVKPGSGNVTLNYKASIFTASLQPNGQIEFNGQSYDSPGAFALHVKRLLNPGKTRDEGWHSVRVDGVLLEEPKTKYLTQKAEEAAAAEAALKAEEASVKKEEAADVKQEEASEPEQVSIYMRQLPPGELPVLPSTYDVHLPEEPEPEGEEVVEEEADTANWVQCSRCQTWRLVPDDFWPDIEASNEEDWYCEEATWDLQQFDPFTKACKEFPGVK